ncbi:type II secretion system F family protein [Candidatus Bathyarchaeota archaeon]|nr:type II secretion system F family protein [Candidatus Bathyarchaeota archaeon]
MSTIDFIYANFGFLGRLLHRISPKIDEDFEAAGIKIYPEAFLSVIGFSTLITFTIAVMLLILERLSIVKFITFFYYLPIFAFTAVIPVIGLLLPKLVASNKVSGLKNEIPFASLYMAVMTSGGLSPYASLLRLGRTDLLPKLRKEILNIQSIVLSFGLDPVSAMEKAAKVMKLKEYRELLLGYVSIIRSGGDVLHYLYNQTENMFKEMHARFKSMGEHMNILMEGYIIIAVLGALGIYMMFVVSFSLPKTGIGFTPENFFLFAFIALPFISVVFIFLADILQINYPLSQNKTYIVFVSTLPFTLFLLSQLVFPFFFTALPVIPQVIDIVYQLKDLLGFEDGTEPAIGMALSLVVSLIPGIIVDHLCLKNERGIFEGLTSFLRDLVENRKMGLSPEKCITLLSRRDYGRFSKYLRVINSKLKWGFSLHQIFEDVRSQIRSWLSQITIYLLVDTIEVGGGTEKSLDTLATFAESINLMEKERKSYLIPLILVAYMGSILLTVTILIFIQLFKGGVTGFVSVPYITLARILLTPLIFHSFMIGIVTGKIVSGRVSAGFLHAFIMVLCSIAAIWLASNYSLMSIRIGGPAR